MKAMLRLTLGLLVSAQAFAYSSVLNIGRGGTNSISTSAALSALGAVPAAGGTMSGTLNVPQINNITAAELGFLSGLTTNIQAAIGGGGVNKAGDTMTGDLTLPAVIAQGSLGGASTVITISTSNATGNDIIGTTVNVDGYRYADLTASVPASLYPTNTNFARYSYLESATTAAGPWTSFGNLLTPQAGQSQHFGGLQPIPPYTHYLRSHYNVTDAGALTGAYNVYTVADSSSSLNNKYLFAYEPTGLGGAQHCFWFDVSGGGSDPCPSGTHHAVAIAANAARLSVATALASSAAGVSAFSGSTRLTTSGGVDNAMQFLMGASTGVYTNPADGNGTGFTFQGWNPPGPIIHSLSLTNSTEAVVTPDVALVSDTGARFHLMAAPGMGFGDVFLAFPADFGSNGQNLSSDGAGNLVWTSPGAPTFPLLASSDGDATSPAYSSSFSTGSGMYFSSGALGFSSNGTELFTLNTTNAAIKRPLQITASGVTATLHPDSMSSSSDWYFPGSLGNSGDYLQSTGSGTQWVAFPTIDASTTPYTPGDGSQWNGSPPTTVGEALDRIAVCEKSGTCVGTGP